MSITKLIVGYTCGVVLLALCACTAYAVYLGHTQGHLMREHFKENSPALTNPGNGYSYIYRQLQFVGGIACVLTFPNFFIKHGTVSAEDIKNFPSHLRFKLVALYRTVISIYMFMALTVGLMESGSL